MEGVQGMHYNCLVVDDETDLAKMTSEYFEMFDVSCACVDSGEKCREFLKDNQVDVLLMDINMEEEGIDVLNPNNIINKNE